MLYLSTLGGGWVGERTFQSSPSSSFIIRSFVLPSLTSPVVLERWVGGWEERHRRPNTYTYYTIHTCEKDNLRRGAFINKAFDRVKKSLERRVGGWVGGWVGG